MAGGRGSLVGGHASLAGGLPEAPAQYDQQAFQRLVDYTRALEEYVNTIEQRVYLRNTHLEIWSPIDSGGRQPLLILRSDDGLTRYSITVDGGGAVIATDIGDTGLPL